MTNTLFYLALLLSGFGIVVQSIFSIQEALQQAIFVIIGVLLYGIIVQKTHPRWLLSTSHVMSFVGFVLLLLLLVFGEPIRGARRWFTFGGFNLQPSVLFIPFWIASFAAFLEAFPPRTIKNYLLALLCIGIPWFFIFRQPDLGTSIVFLLTIGAVLIASKPKMHYLLITLLLCIPLFFIMPRFLHSYQITRLTAFLDPTIDPKGANYNSIQAIIAIGSGGFFGKGFFNATQARLHFLPEAHTDFVFAAFTEVFGFLGSFILITVFSLFLISFVRMLRQRQTPTSTYFTIGALFYLLVEWVLNTGMNLRLLPVVGVPLPLISYGGTAILTVFLLLAMAKKFQEL